MNRKPVFGLLGGIGSGKSMVAEIFAQHGGRVINADKIGHDALRDNDIRRRIVERWGPGLLDEQGEVIRRRLGAIVFEDEKERRLLETIVHPWIGQRLREAIAAAQADERAEFIILDAAIMLEAGWHNACDKLVFVDTPPSMRLDHIARQRGWTPEQVAKREAAQLPLTEKAAQADYVLDNSGTPAQLEKQVNDLLREWGLKDR